MFKKYKVVVMMTAYPSGSPLAINERYFDTESEAMEFCKENNWENPTETSTATVYEYKVKADWFPID